MSRAGRYFLASVGWTGHLFPVLALARELRTRGHEVLVETFEERRDTVEGIGATFAPSAEQISVPGAPELGEGPSLARVAAELVPLIEDWRPDVVVTDMFTLAPALAAEVAGIRRATLIPHPYPVHEPGLPFYTLGVRAPRTPLGRLAWKAMWPAIGTRLPNTSLRRRRAEIDAVRAELGLGPLKDFDGQISDRLALVATFPQLEYPRRWPSGANVIGPMPFELPFPDVELPADGPIVLVAASTERDPEHRLARLALEALEDEPVQVVVALNRRGESWAGGLPSNGRVLDWVSYAQAMPRASAVICHGGHGTMTRALLEGVPVIVSPRAGDQAENGARVAWSGAGLMVPERLLTARSLRLATRQLLGEPRHGARAGELATWGRENGGAETAALLVEETAR